MKNGALVLGLCLVLVGSMRTAEADTHAPTTATVVLQCGGETVTFVSPTSSAEAGQVVGSTGVGVLQLVLFVDGSGSTVVFEHPGFHAHKPSKLTTCTETLPEGTLIFVFLQAPLQR
jgi:hypothetical protein